LVAKKIRPEQAQLGNSSKSKSLLLKTSKPYLLFSPSLDGATMPPPPSTLAVSCPRPASSPAQYAARSGLRSSAMRRWLLACSHAPFESAALGDLAPPPPAPTASPPTHRLPRLAARLYLLLQRRSAPPVWAIFVALVDHPTTVAERNSTRKYFATTVMDFWQWFASESIAGISRDAPDPSSISRASKKVDKNTLSTGIIF
jgi:hypothetical protein